MPEMSEEKNTAGETPEETNQTAKTQKERSAQREVAYAKEAQARSGMKTAQFVDYIYWVIMAMIIVRFVFKLIGANAENALVKMLYSASDPFINIFKGIVPDITASTNHIIEISSLIGLLIIWLVYHAILKLIVVLRSR